MDDAAGGRAADPAGPAAGPAAGTGAPAGKLRRYQWLSTLGAAARTRRGMVGLALTAVVVLIAAIGPFVTPYSPTALVTETFAPPSHQFLLGGDDLGRDVLSRVLAGGWVLLLMAAAAAAFGVIVGAAAGISAAYLRGRTDGFIMRSVDVVLAFPQLVFALLLVSIIGPKLWLIVIAVGFSHAPAVARVLRSSTLDVSERDFVKSTELQGVAPPRIMVREILPNLVSPLMVEIGLRLTYSIGIIAALAFLGFGQEPPAPNWGTMINENRLGLTVNPWGVVVPVLLIALLTIGTNTFTDAIARVAIGVERPLDEVAPLDEVGLPTAARI
jgi:peptide/nickel transport system permease protein